MKIFNTLNRKKEGLVPLNEGVFNIYACGPTVYNFIHIGNARPLCVFDVLRRYLEWRGYTVNFVQNFTDIDDKLINRAIEEQTTVPALAEKYIAEFTTDSNGLNVRPATHHPRATNHMDDILALVAALIEKGYAYQSGGDVYFRTDKFEEYGKLSHQPLEDLMSGARININETKESPMDFALWKAAKPNEPSWPSPYGEGRPGWHIECSAMAGKILGKTIDIHCGGQDLIFPHHENEIAQSECANNAPFARYWMHNGYINVDNKKMSKSLGNFFTVRDVAEKYGYEPIRYFMIAAHYRSPINYTPDLIEQSKSALSRLQNCQTAMRDYASSNIKNSGEQALGDLTAYKQKFIDAMDDDLNTADALAVLFELAKACNMGMTASISSSDITAALTLFDELCGVLGILPEKQTASLDAEVEALIAQRTAARAARDFAAADQIRDKLTDMGIELLDTKDGVKWRMK